MAAARTDILSEVELEGAVVALVVVEAPLTADAPLRPLMVVVAAPPAIEWDPLPSVAAVADSRTGTCTRNLTATSCLNIFFTCSAAHQQTYSITHLHSTAPTSSSPVSQPPSAACVPWQPSHWPPTAVLTHVHAASPRSNQQTQPMTQQHLNTIISIIIIIHIIISSSITSSTRQLAREPNRLWTCSNSFGKRKRCKMPPISKL